MANAADPSRKRYTAIVRRGETETFARLTRAADQVLWDRRFAERRAGMGAPPGAERRRAERRRSPAGMWATLGFVIVWME
jgi:hypothetical protein